MFVRRKREMRYARGNLILFTDDVCNTNQLSSIDKPKKNRKWVSFYEQKKTSHYTAFFVFLILLLNFNTEHYLIFRFGKFIGLDTTAPKSMEMYQIIQ